MALPREHQRSGAAARLRRGLCLAISLGPPCGPDLMSRSTVSAPQVVMTVFYRAMRPSGSDCKFWMELSFARQENQIVGTSAMAVNQAIGRLRVRPRLYCARVSANYE